MSSSARPAVGLLCAVLSAVFNGSFTVPFKAAAASSHSDQRRNSLEVHPIVFTLYVSVGVFLSSMIMVAPFLPAISINIPSILAGFLFVLGVSASFHAVDLIGMALSQGIWAGSATVVSYVWGTIVFGDYPAHPLWSVFGLMLLVIGVVGIAFCNDIAQRIRSGSKEELEPLHSGVAISMTLSDDDNEHAPDATRNTQTPTAYASGVFWACAVGLFGGSILAPTHYLQPDEQGLAVLPSFGIGCVILAPIVLLGNNLWTKQLPPFNLQNALIPGLFSGLLWNISNLLSLIAIPSIGYGVAYPLLQAAVLVSGLWGISVFKEITDRRTIVVFWIAGGILLLGAAMLATSQ